MLWYQVPTLSFINPATAKRLACKLDEMDVQLCVAIQVGSIYRTESVVRNCLIAINGRVFPADLIFSEIQGYDVSGLLARHKATIDCERKLLTLITLEGERLLHRETNPKQTIPIISATQAFRMVRKDCPANLCVVEVAETQKPNPGEIPVVWEFLRVFQEVSGLPPDQEIEFMIEIVPGTAPISKAPYKMEFAELAELKTQL